MNTQTSRPIKWVEPLLSARKPLRRRLNDEEWTTGGRKEKIIKLHRSNKTCREIQKIMLEKYGLEASIASYKVRFKEWGLRDYFTHQQRRFILKERARRGKMPIFRYIDTNQIADKKKLERLWENRHRYGAITRNESLSPGGLTVISSPSSSPRPEIIQGSSRPFVSAHSSVDSIPNLIEGEVLENGVKPLRITKELDKADHGSSVMEISSVGWPEQLVDKCEPFSSVLHVGKPMSSLSTSEINDIMEGVLRILNIPLDYQIQRISTSGIVGPLTHRNRAADHMALEITQPQTPWRAELGNISPMTPNSIEVFMSSGDVTNITNILHHANGLLPRWKTCAGPRLELPSPKFTEEFEPQNIKIVADPQYYVLSCAESSQMPQAKETFKVDLNTLEEINFPGVVPYTSNNAAHGRSWQTLTKGEHDELRAVKSYLNAARSLSSECRVLEARTFLESALGSKMFSRCFGLKSLAFLDAYYDLCRCMTMKDPMTLEDICWSKSILEEICQGYEAELGLLNWRTRRCYNLMAVVLKAEGELDMALEYLQLALLGVDFDDTSEETEKHISEIYELQSYNLQPVKVNECILDGNAEKGAFNFCNADPSKGRGHLAQMFMKIGDYPTALYQLRGIEDLYRQRLIWEFPYTLVIRARIAECLLKLNMVGEARFESESIHSDLLVRSQLNNLDPNLWRLLGSMLITLADTHNFKKAWGPALRYYYDSLRVYTTKLGSQTERNARVATARICEVLINRGPVLYLEPLANYHIDIQRRLNEPVSPRVVEWLSSRRALVPLKIVPHLRYRDFSISRSGEI